MTLPTHAAMYASRMSLSVQLRGETEGRATRRSTQPTDLEAVLRMTKEQQESKAPLQRQLSSQPLWLLEAAPCVCSFPLLLICDL